MCIPNVYLHVEHPADTHVSYLKCVQQDVALSISKLSTFDYYMYLVLPVINLKGNDFKCKTRAQQRPHNEL